MSCLGKDEPSLIIGRDTFFGKGLILEQFDAMVMNIANSHRLSEAKCGAIVWAPESPQCAAC